MRALPILVPLSVVVFAVGCALCGTSSHTTVAQVEQQLAQTLPVGSTRAEVDRWLQAKGIDSSYTERPDENYSSLVNEVVSDIRTYSGATCALIRDTDRSLFVTGSIQIYFLYGPDDRLATKIVKWIGTGL